MAEGHVGASDDLLARVATAGVTTRPDAGEGSGGVRTACRVIPPPHVAALLARVGVTDHVAHFADLARRAGRLRDHGIRVVSGLDAGAMPAKRHGQLWRAVVELVDGGWPVDEAIATATATGR